MNEWGESEHFELSIFVPHSFELSKQYHFICYVQARILIGKDNDVSEMIYWN